MKTYTFDDPALGQISYRDDKRHLWLIAVFFPLIPFLGMGLAAWSGQEWMLWVPLVVWVSGRLGRRLFAQLETLESHSLPIFLAAQCSLIALMDFS